MTLTKQDAATEFACKSSTLLSKVSTNNIEIDQKHNECKKLEGDSHKRHGR